MTQLVCATHGHCFDGMASAALLTELAYEIRPPQTVNYVACTYGPHTNPPRLDGDENALLDFRYEATDRLTYYFDHHATAFRSPEDERHFQGRHTGNAERFIWDPNAVSCAGLLARHARKQWDLRWPKHAELIAWADKIDGAQFPSAEAATNRAEPILRLAAVIERFGDNRFLAQAVPVLRSEGLFALSEARFIKDFYRRLAPKFRAYEKRIRERGTVIGRVAFIDLSEKPVTVVAKFAQYREFPQAPYSVILASAGGGWKISAGYNPWNGAPLDVNIGEICQDYGGGGHPVVGAVSFDLSEHERAKVVAQTIANRLQEANES